MLLITARMRVIVGWLAVCLGLAACTSQEADLPAPAVFSVAAAQAWFHTLPPARALSGAVAESAWAPNWRRAHSTTDGTTQLVLSPLNGDAARFAQSTYRGSRYLVASRRPGEPVQGLLVELLLAPGAAPLDTVALLRALARPRPQVPAALTGLVLLYRADYAYRQGWAFHQGRRVASGVSLRVQAPPPAAGRAAPPKAVNALAGSTCTDYYQRYADGTVTYITSSCRPAMQDGPGGYRGELYSGWGGPISRYEGTGGGSSGTLPPPTTMVQEYVDPRIEFTAAPEAPDVMAYNCQQLRNIHSDDPIQRGNIGTLSAFISANSGLTRRQVIGQRGVQSIMPGISLSLGPTMRYSEFVNSSSCH